MTAEEFWDRLFHMSVGAMNEKERNYFACNALAVEVDTGGLQQYFVNQIPPPDVVEAALTALGAHTTLEVFQAARLLGADLKQLTARLKASGEDLYALLDKYAERHGLYGPDG